MIINGVVNEDDYVDSGVCYFLELLSNREDVMVFIVKIWEYVILIFDIVGYIIESLNILGEKDVNKFMELVY